MSQGGRSQAVRVTSASSAPLPDALRAQRIGKVGFRVESVFKTGFTRGLFIHVPL